MVNPSGLHSLDRTSGLSGDPSHSLLGGSPTSDAARALTPPPPSAWKGPSELGLQWFAAHPDGSGPDRGTIYDGKVFKEHLYAALAAAGIEATMRPFHDLRHTAITNDAAAGASPVAIMTKAGHASMNTTRDHIHLAGVVFRDEANALEARLLGKPSTERSTPVGRSQRTYAHLSGSRTRQ